MNNKFIAYNKNYNLPNQFLKFFYRIIKYFFKPKTICIKKIKKLGIRYFVFINEDIGFRMLFPGLHELNEIRILDNLFKLIINRKEKNIVFIDVGVNFGLFSIYFAKQLKNEGHVYAFEPEEKCINLIKKNSLLNNINNITIHECAVSDKIGFTQMSNVDDQTALGYVDNVKKEHDDSNKIKVITLDSIFVKEKKEIDIVKIDVEGHETSVINGFKSSLSDKRISPKVMMIELVDEHLARFGHNKVELISFINSFGYEPYINYRGKKLEEYSTLRKGIYNIFFIKKDFLDQVNKSEIEKIFK